MKESISVGLRLDNAPTDAVQAFLRHSSFLVSRIDSTTLQDPLVSLFEHALDKQSSIQVLHLIYSTLR